MSPKEKQASTDWEVGFSEICKNLRSSLTEGEARAKELGLKEKEVNILRERSEILKEEMDLRQKALDAGEKQMYERIKWVELREKVLDKREKQVNERIKEMELRDKADKECSELRSQGSLEMRIRREAGEKKTEKVELNKEETALKLEGLEVKKQSKALESKNEEIDGSCKVLEPKEKSINEGCKEPELVGKDVDESLQAVELQEKKASEDFDAVLKEKRNNGFRKTISLKEKEASKSLEPVELRKKEPGECSKGIKRKRPYAVESKQLEGLKELQMKAKQTDESRIGKASKEKDMNEPSQAVQVKEKQATGPIRKEDLRGQQLNDTRHLAQEYKDKCQPQVTKEKQVDGRCQSLKLEGKIVSTPCKAQDLEAKELKGGQIAENCKVVASKNGLSHTDIMDDKITPNEYMAVQNDEAEYQSLVSLCHPIKGKVLQMFLNERVHKHQSMRKMVGTALHMSDDPGKVVLAALEGFFPPHLRRGDSFYKRSDTRKSCLLLLELLMNIKPVIGEDVRSEALEMANNWKKKMRANESSPTVVLGFLMLLVTYKLQSNYQRIELQKLCERIGHHELEPQLRHRLGLSEINNGIVSTSRIQLKIGEPQPETLQVTNTVASSKAEETKTAAKSTVKKISPNLTRRTEAQNTPALPSVDQSDPHNGKGHTSDSIAPTTPEMLPRSRADQMLPLRHPTGAMSRPPGLLNLTVLQTDPTVLPADHHIAATGACVILTTPNEFT